MGRKKDLLKKVYELATLCDMPLSVVIYSGPSSAPVTYPENEDEVRAVIERYTSGSMKANAKRSINLQQRLKLVKRKKKDGQNMAKYASKCSRDGFSREELVELGSVLDYKLYQVEERIRMAGLRGRSGNYNGDANSITTTSSAMQCVKVRWANHGVGDSHAGP